MKTLVTGTAGFIGYHTANRLLDRGDEVVGIDIVNDYYSVELKNARLDRLKKTGSSASPATETSSSTSSIFQIAPPMAKPKPPLKA